MARGATLTAVLLIAIAGCGSAPDRELPPPAGPAVSPPLTAEPAGRVVEGRALPPAMAVRVGDRVARVAGRARRLELFEGDRRVASAPAGTGPTNVASDGGHYLYVTDTVAGAVLVFRAVPRLRLTRRYALPGAPYGIAYDPAARRLWVTLTATNEVVELAAGARPHRLRRFPTVRQPDRVAIERTGRVLVAGAGMVQLLDPRRTR
jgi:DNA-binding beta-propeller fold protein YncE